MVCVWHLQTGQLVEVARGNPQWPQAFYSMKRVFDVEDGDMLFARCTYDSTSRNRTTFIGNYYYILLYGRPVIRSVADTVPALKAGETGSSFALQTLNV